METWSKMFHTRYIRLQSINLFKYYPSIPLIVYKLNCFQIVIIQSRLFYDTNTEYKYSPHIIYQLLLLYLNCSKIYILHSSRMFYGTSQSNHKYKYSSHIIYQLLLLYLNCSKIYILHSSRMFYDTSQSTINTNIPHILYINCYYTI